MALARILTLAASILCAATLDQEALDQSQTLLSDIADALALDDECQVGGGEGPSCGLQALQLRSQALSGRRQSSEQTLEQLQLQQRLQQDRLEKRQREKAEASRATLEKFRRQGWTQRSRCHGAELHELDFFIQPLNETQIREMALDRTNPDSPNYRHWLTRNEVRDLTRNVAAMVAVKDLLSKHDGVEVLLEVGSGDVLRARAPIRTWEHLLGAEFYRFEHPDRSSHELRALSYALPESLKGHVGGVLNILEFSPPALGRSSKEPEGFGLVEAEESVPSDPPNGLLGIPHMTQKGLDMSSIVTPTKLRKIYDMPPIAERGSKMAGFQANLSQVIYGTLNESWSPADRTEFEAQFGIPQDSYVRQLAGQEEGHAMSGDAECRKNPESCDEASLDVQYVAAMSPWSKLYYWYVHDTKARSMGHFLTGFLAHLLNDKEDPLPQVISMSYGMREDFASNDARDMFEVMAMKLTLLGISIFVATGDDGAIGYGMSADGGDCSLFQKEDGMMPFWPASSSWVTAVGATTGPASGNTEVVCQINASASGIGKLDIQIGITSGGGYSRAFKRPDWQNGTVNDTGRGIPDVSLLGHLYAVRVGGRYSFVDGTSASAPVLAGMTTLINGDLAAAGLPPVGFLNPLLYSDKAKHIFNDVVEGDNRCGKFGNLCCGGFDATEGWDPVTGLGSLSWKKLRDLVMSTGR